MVRPVSTILIAALVATTALGQLQDCSIQFYDTGDCTGGAVLFPWSSFQGASCVGVSFQDTWESMFRNADGSAEYVQYNDTSNPESQGCFGGDEVERRTIDNWFLGEGDLSDWSPGGSSRAKNTCYADNLFGTPFCYEEDCSTYNSWQWVCVDIAPVSAETCEVEFFSDDSCASGSPVMTLNSGDCFGIPTTSQWWKATSQPDGKLIYEGFRDDSNPASLGCDSGSLRYEPETNREDPFRGTGNWRNYGGNNLKIIKNTCIRGDFLESMQPMCAGATCEPYGSYRWSCENQPELPTCYLEFYSGSGCSGGVAGTWSDGECFGLGGQWISIHGLTGSEWAFNQNYFVDTESNGCHKADVLEGEVDDGRTVESGWRGIPSEDLFEGLVANVCNDEQYLDIGNFCVQDSCFDHNSFRYVCE